MHAIVFAERKGHELLPLTNRTAVPLLPILGKPLIVHTLEDLANANVRSAIVVLGSEDKQTKKVLGNGTTSGLHLSYATARPGETPGHIARRLGAELPEKLLAVRGDVLRGQCTKSFLAAAGSVLATQVVATTGGRSASLCLCRQQDLHLDVLDWPQQTPLPADANWRCIELGRIGYSTLDSITSYYLAHLDGMERRFKDIELPTSAMMQDQCLTSGIAIIGKGVEIAADATLHGPLVLGDGVTIGEGVFMHSCIVMPGTHIPDGQSIRNAIINSDMAIGMDGKIIYRSPDRQAGKQNAVEMTNVRTRPQKAKAV